MRFTTKLAAVLAGFSLAAAPAFALDGGGDPGVTTDTTTTVDTTATTLQPTVTQTPQGPPTTIPPAYGPTSNPGSSHVPPAQARALGRIECQQFKRVFDAPPRNEFGKCIADLAKMIRLDLSNPREACSNMLRQRQEGERRSNFSACVVAATRALHEIGA